MKYFNTSIDWQCACYIVSFFNFFLIPTKLRILRCIIIDVERNDSLNCCAQYTYPIYSFFVFFLCPGCSLPLALLLSSLHIKKINANDKTCKGAHTNSFFCLLCTFSRLLWFHFYFSLHSFNQQTTVKEPYRNDQTDSVYPKWNQNNKYIKMCTICLLCVWVNAS